MDIGRRRSSLSRKYVKVIKNDDCRIPNFWFMVKMNITQRLQKFIECEGKSCSFDPELITPEYVYRMWGGTVAIGDIATAMEEVRRMRL